MLDESLFEYYNIHLTGDVVSNADTNIPDDPDKPDDNE